jgi:hypothetical protein
MYMLALFMCIHWMCKVRMAVNELRSLNPDNIDTLDEESDCDETAEAKMVQNEITQRKRVLLDTVFSAVMTTDLLARTTKEAIAQDDSILKPEVFAYTNT